MAFLAVYNGSVYKTQIKYCDKLVTHSIANLHTRFSYRSFHALCIDLQTLYQHQQMHISMYYPFFDAIGVLKDLTPVLLKRTAIK